jgi:hypothetical protein
MRKFIVHTRPVPGCRKDSDAPTVVEVEGEMIQGVEDPSVLWLPEGEFRFRIMKPEFLYEPAEIKKEDGTKEKITVPPVYHSHVIYASVDQARAEAERLVRAGFEFAERKRDVPFTDQEVKAKVCEITEILL